jgi:flagellar hook-associated protein 3 FlgL
LSNGLTTANQNIDNVLNNVLTVRASVGSRLKELDNLDSDGDNRNLLFAQTLSSLTDLDYVSAISNMSQQTTTLDAAQKSFVKVTGLSLFNYI